MERTSLNLSDEDESLAQGSNFDVGNIKQKDNDMLMQDDMITASGAKKNGHVNLWTSDNERFLTNLFSHYAAEHTSRNPSDEDESLACGSNFNGGSIKQKGNDMLMQDAKRVKILSQLRLLPPLTLKEPQSFSQLQSSDTFMRFQMQKPGKPW